jgi:hypothetical protein
MYLVEKVELLVYNRMAWGHEKGHRQVEGLDNTYNATAVSAIAWS